MSEKLERSKVEKQLQDKYEELAAANERGNVKKATKLLNEEFDLLGEEKIIDEADEKNKELLNKQSGKIN